MSRFEIQLHEGCVLRLEHACGLASSLGLTLQIGGRGPVSLQPAILRAVDELLMNAVRHGFYGRCSGRILVQVDSVGVAVRIRTTDDGWGFLEDTVVDGTGFSVLRSLGKLSVERGSGRAKRTQVTLDLLASTPDPETRRLFAVPRSRNDVHA